MRHTRRVGVRDAPRLAELVVADRESMAPYEPPRTDEFFTSAGQRALVERALQSAEWGRTLPLVILDDEQEVVGRITLQGIVRGPLLSANVGYWVAREANGRGLATAALGEVVEIAFGELGLHRLDAGTLVDNVASQRVLAHHGFQRYGLAPRFLHVGGQWRDHLLFQLLNPRPCDPETGRGY